MTSFISRLLDKGERFVESLHPNLETRGTKLREIRRKRENQLEKWAEYGSRPPLYDEYKIEVLVDMGLQEAELLPEFNPDLLVVTEPQYKCMFDIPAGVPIDPDDWHHYFETAGTESDRERILPPSQYRVDAGTIDVVYSSSAERMLLVESDSL
jgi:hypothetical protein